MRKQRKMQGKKEKEKLLISTGIMALPDPAQGKICYFKIGFKMVPMKRIFKGVDSLDNL